MGTYNFSHILFSKDVAVELKSKIKMKMFITAVLLGVCFLCAGSKAGWAGPNFYGPVEKSSSAVFGHQGYQLCYSAEQVNTVGTLLCCEGLGFGNGGRTRQWYNLGCSNSGPVKRCVSWGAVAATPEIKCKGIPLGTMYSWSH